MGIIVTSFFPLRSVKTTNSVYREISSGTEFNVLLIGEQFPKYIPDLYSEAASLLLDRGITVHALSEFKSTTKFGSYDVIIWVFTTSDYIESRAEYLRQYVISGGSLLIVRYDSSSSDFEAWLADYGVLIDSEHSGEGEVTLAQHELTDNVWSIEGFNGPALSLSSPNWEPIVVTDDPIEWGHEDHLPLLVVREYGEGRVALSSSHNVFSNPEIDRADNWILFLNIVFWLANFPLPDVFNAPIEIKTIEDEINALNDLLDTLTEEKNQLESLIDELQSDIEGFVRSSTLYKSLENQFESLEGNYEELINNYNNLEGEYNKTIVNYNSLESDFDSLTNTMESLRSQIEELESKKAIIPPQFIIIGLAIIALVLISVRLLTKK
jgi:hypothetical protein